MFHGKTRERNQPLPIGFSSSFIRFREIKPKALWVSDVQLLNQIERSLAQRLTDWVKENKNQIRQFAWKKRDRKVPLNLSKMASVNDCKLYLATGWIR